MISKIKENLNNIKKIKMKRNNIKKDEILNNIKLSNRLPISFSDKVFDNLFEIFKIGLLKDGILKYLV